MKRWFFITFLALGTLACAEDKGDKKKSKSGAPEDTDTTTDPETTDPKTGSSTGSETETETGVDPDPSQGAKTPVLAFFGGYTSCGIGDSGDPLEQPLADFFNKTKAAVKKKTGKDPKFWITCYTLAYESVLYKFSGSDQLHDKLIAGMESDFEDFLGELDGPEVLMVGHSYGGWTAMDILSKLPPGAKVKGLVTLDPISHADCTLATFGSEACKRSPQDFGEEGIKDIKARVDQWLNYWEDGSTTLHSSEIVRAQNVKRIYPGNGFAPHNAFLTDEAIGAEIESLADHAF